MKGGVVGVGLALALVAGGCGRERTSVIVYWDFQRHTLTQGDVVYDANVNVGGGDAACDEAGVDTVTITDEAGQLVNPELPSIPCVFAGVQGVQINDVRRGRRVWTVTGFRGTIPTYVGTVEVDLREGLNELSVTAAGIPDDLDVNIAFFNARGALLGDTCAAVGVGFLTYNLQDGVGTVVASGDIPCPNPPGFTFRVASGTGIDRDTYTIRIQGFRDATSPDPVFDDQTTSLVPECQVATFDHLGTDVGPNGWTVAVYDVSAPAQRLCR